VSLSDNRAKGVKTLRQVLTDIVNSYDGIYSGFCVDTDGLLIEEVNLEGTMGKESSLILCSLVAGIHSSLDTIGKEIGSSPWVSFTSESDKFKLLLRDMGRIAFLGVLADPYVDLELLNLIIGPAIDVILEILQKGPFQRFLPDLTSSLHVSQEEIDQILKQDSD
jgi:predicted regulator of Ras-like GTPase activity (Roadblock/LC7/MglB family)